MTAASYRKAIDSLENGHFAKAGADERLALRQMFNRGDFMRGYAMGAEDAAVIYPQRVNHLGVPLGKIERVERGFARFTPLLALHDGDGLQLRAESAPDQDMIYSGKEIPAGAGGAAAPAPGYAGEARHAGLPPDRRTADGASGGPARTVHCRGHGV